MKRILLTISCCALGLNLFAQNVGINTTGATPNSAAILDLNTGNAGNMGFLAPQVSLTNITVWAPVTGAATNGMLVYNTAGAPTGGNGVGYYYWYNNQWNYLQNAGTNTAWLLLGNAGTTAGTNFVGTTDNTSLTFKTAGTRVGFLDVPANGNVFFASGAGTGNTGTYNEAIGYNALQNSNSGTQNVAVGNSALYANTTGAYNTALGQYAIYNSSSGQYNIGVGYQALYGNSGSITGSNNVAIGQAALENNNSGSYNISIGQSSMLWNQSGQENVAVGVQSLYGTSGVNQTADVAVGYLAMYGDGGSSYSIGVGYYACAGSTGMYNIGIGDEALQFAGANSRNIAIGGQAMYSESNGGSDNTALGYYSMQTLSSGASQNVGIGSQVNGGEGVAGSGNVVLGYSADYGGPGIRNSRFAKHFYWCI